MSEYQNRNEIPDKYKWDLTKLYQSLVDFEKDFSFVEINLKNVSRFKGELKSKEGIIAYLNTTENIEIILEKLGLYVFLNKDLDLDNKESQSIYNRVQDLNSKYIEAISFASSEILENKFEDIEKWCEAEGILRQYQHYFENLFRTKEHTLTSKEEKILALSSNISSVASNTFSLLKNADLEFPTIKDEKGNDFEISDGKYGSAMYSTNREFRKEVYQNYYRPYIKFQNTLSSLFNGNIKTQSFYAKARGYSSTLEMSLKPKNIPLEVYHKLIETANDNVGVLHRWASLRKKLLNLDELHPYDSYVTLFPESKKSYSYDEACELVLKSLEVLGKDYVNDVKDIISGNRIDVYETKGKRSGAYSSGTTFGEKPYILLNWNNELNDVFTLTHEIGHNIHSLYTGLNQPYQYANYTIFLAEVASTLNEALLLDYLIENSTSKLEKLSLLELYANKFVTTFFRQIGFAEFELLTHKAVENGNQLTSNQLTEKYTQLYSKYWGKEMVVDMEEGFTWARVPHFYYGFYVYQYATGLAASEKLAENIKNNSIDGVKNLLYFLKKGSSDYSINILKDSGVDMLSEEPVIACIKKFDSIITEIENLTIK